MQIKPPPREISVGGRAEKQGSADSQFEYSPASSKPTNILWLEKLTENGLAKANPHQISFCFPYIRATKQTNIMEVLNKARSLPTRIEAWITRVSMINCTEKATNLHNLHKHLYATYLRGWQVASST